MEGIKKALVFGGSGFIGLYVVEELLRRGYGVTNFSTGWSDCDVNDMEGYYDCIEGTILDWEKVRDLIGYVEPDVIMNFAGIADIEECNKEPWEAFETNVSGNNNILYAIQDKIKKPKFIFASSLYVNSEKGGAYGLAKDTCERWVRLYSKKYNFPHTIIRYGTIYGLRAKENNSIKKLVKKALKDGVVSHYGTGEEMREYIDVRDIARCTCELIDKGIETVILSGVYPTKAMDLMNMVKEMIGAEGIEFRGEKPDDHYIVTPYSFVPEQVVKYDIGSYRDLAGGLLEVVKEVHNERD